MSQPQTSVDPASSLAPVALSDPELAQVSRRWRTATVVLLVALVAGAVGGLWAWRTASYRPPETSAEVGFARDMVTHHQQAVTMSFLVRDRTDDPEVRALALDLVTNQSEELGMLTGWLRRHDVPASSTVPPMAWMGTPVPGGDEHTSDHVMPDGATMTLADMGLASDDDLTRLARLDGREAEVLFLDLLREHHEGALTMLDAYLERATDDDLRTLAEGMLTAQNREIRQVDLLLGARTASA